MNQFIARRRLHYGWIVVAVAGAVLQEEAGDYVLAFLLAGALAVAAGVASLYIKRNQRPVLLVAT